MRLLKLYKDILESLQVHSDDVGLLSHRRLDGQVEQINVSVDGHSKRLVLPNPELLRKGLPDELVAFHPLSEISNRGESEVFRKLKLLVNLRLTTVLTTLAVDLAELAADKDRRKGLSPKLLPLLEALPNADAKFVDNLESVIGAALAGGRNRLLSIYMSRGGKYMGEKHARVAVVSFPFLAELDDPERKVFGVQLRAKDIPQIKALFDWILPNSDMKGTYDAFSDSMDAPYFDALVNAFGKVSRQLNKIIKLAGKHLTDAPNMHSDLDWLPELADLEKMRFEIPALDGNKGIGVGSGKSEEAEAAQPRSGLDALQSRVSAAEPVRKPVEPNAPPPKKVVEDEPVSSINTGITSDELHRQRQQTSFRPITTASATLTPEQTPRTGGSRTLSEIMGQTNVGGLQPIQGFHNTPPQNNGGWVNGGWNGGHVSQPNAFAMVNVQSTQMHQQQHNAGWRSGWSSNSGRF